MWHVSTRLNPLATMINCREASYTSKRCFAHRRWVLHIGKINQGLHTSVHTFYTIAVGVMKMNRIGD